MPRSAWAVEPREETGDGTESSAMLDRGSGPPGSRRYVIEGNTCLLRLYIARLIYHACFRTSMARIGFRLFPVRLLRSTRERLLLPCVIDDAGPNREFVEVCR